MASTSGDRSRHFPAIEAKHGKPVSHWLKLLAKMGDAKYAEQIALLRNEYGFSQAHANAVVMQHRGSTTSRRFATPEDYFASLDEPRVTTARTIFAVIQQRYGDLELVTAWNQPVLRNEAGYVLGLSAAKQHLLLNPFSKAVIEAMTPKLTGYRVSKHTFAVPADWKPDAALLHRLVRLRLAELQ